MTTPRLRSALVASALSFGIAAFVPASGLAQNTTVIPDEGGPITIVGCFAKGVIGHDKDERFVLAKPIVGSIASVPEATCSASGTDQMIKLQDLKQVHMGEAQFGRWVEIQGRLESNNRSDGLREIHVKSFSLVPVVVPPPKVAEVTPAPAPFVESPAPVAPSIAEAAPEAPAPVATTGERKALPKTATSLPLVGLIGVLSLAAWLPLRLFTRRRADAV